jgi:hypothetical protein
MSDLVEIIENELFDRIESEEVEEIEIDKLRELKEKVSNGLDLSFSEYQWLCDLVSAASDSI